MKSSKIVSSKRAVENQMMDGRGSRWEHDGIGKKRWKRLES